MLRTLSLLLSGALLVGCNQQNTRTVKDENRPESTPTSTTVLKPVANDPQAAPDNTANNMRDRSPAAITPIDQKENKTDVQTTADIRGKIMAAKLSINAQNVKIITQDGHVTLRGPVDTAVEKDQIEKMARIAVGDNFESFLEVTPSR
jgi:hyperosmotically inducible protein